MFKNKKKKPKENQSDRVELMTENKTKQQLKCFKEADTQPYNRFSLKNLVFKSGIKTNIL